MKGDRDPLLYMYDNARTSFDHGPMQLPYNYLEVRVFLYPCSIDHVILCECDCMSSEATKRCMPAGT